jgi:hypothetical protein
MQDSASSASAITATAGMLRCVRTALILLLAVACLTSCGSSTQAMHALGSDTKLKSLVRERGIRLGRNVGQDDGSLRAALSAFAEFAEIPIAEGDLDRDPMSDGLLFEFGVFDFGGVWGNTLTLSFVRQYGMADGDLQQVHLEAHFPAAALPVILRRTHAEACDGRDCVFRCAYGGASDLVGGERCAVTSEVPGRSPPLHSASLWSFDAGEAGTGAARIAWLRLVKESPPFKYLSSHDDLLLGYEVWQESAE